MVGTRKQQTRERMSVELKAKESDHTQHPVVASILAHTKDEIQTQKI